MPGTESKATFILSSPQPQWVILEGADARDYLQRVTSLPVSQIEENGAGFDGFFLDPQARILSAFTAWRIDPQLFGFELCGSPGAATQLLSDLERLHFSEKIAFQQLAELKGVWFFSSENPWNLSPHQSIALPENIRLCRHREVSWTGPLAGLDWYSAFGTKEALETWLTGTFPQALNLSPEDFDDLRIEALFPLCELWMGANPLELGMFEALKFQKGCYPGQEVIERILSLGAPARRLCQVSGGKLGEKIFSLAEPPMEVGVITTASQNPKGSSLGLIKKLFCKEGTRLKTESGVTVEIQKIAPFQSASPL